MNGKPPRSARSGKNGRRSTWATREGRKEGRKEGRRQTLVSKKEGRTGTWVLADPAYCRPLTNGTSV